MKIKSFENKELDIIVSSLSPFPDSHKGPNVLQIPFNIAFYGNFYTRHDSSPVRTLDDLHGKTVLVLQGSVGHDYIKNIAGTYNITVLPYPTTESAMKALSEGVGDASMFSLTAAINALDAGGYTNIRVSGRPVFPASYGFLFHEGSEAYDILADAMDKLKAKGSYFDIIKKWQSNQNTSIVWLKRVAVAIGLILAVFLGVMIWNKMLYEQVRRKTSELNQEMEQRRLTEQENLKLRDEAMIAGKLAVLGEMATSIVHEINNPTGLIIHNVDFLLKLQTALRDSNFALSEDARICGMKPSDAMAEADDALAAIEESLTRITNTINELKEYGREQTDSAQLINLEDCVNIAARLSRYFIKNYTNKFMIDIKPGEYEFYGNMLHIEQVIINLIHNACYALTSKEQAIVCMLENRSIDAVLYAVLSVKDEGLGMDDDIKSKLFTPFFTTRRDSGGTGLGFTIISRLVNEHNGYIDIQSAPGKGSTVSVYLPLESTGEQI